MSNTNYDIAKSLSYGGAGYSSEHGIPVYQISVPYYKYETKKDVQNHSSYSKAYYSAAISFDDKQEETIEYEWSVESTTSSTAAYNKKPPSIVYCDAGAIQASGVFSKIYFRNPYRSAVSFTGSGSQVRCKINYAAEQPYEIQFNSDGYIAQSNPSFKISTVQKNTYLQYYPTTCEVYYKKSTAGSYTQATNVTFSGSWSDIDVTLNGVSFEAGYTYNIKVQCFQTLTYGTITVHMTSNTIVGNFATTDGTAVATCVSPVGVYTNRTVNFIWSHYTEYGTPQYAYDLQYSANNGSSWTTVANHVVSSTNNTTVNINSAGLYLWRVRTYNTLNQAGSWSQASFINNIPANPPSGLQVTTKGRPTVSWVASSQSAYQVQVLLNGTITYDSGAIYTGQTSHFINDYFDDTRAYQVRARLYNNLGNVSGWVSTGYQQPEVLDVEFDVEQNVSGGAKITLYPDETFQKYYIKRNGVLIGQFINNTYVDYFASGQTNYTVVGITPDDYSDMQTKELFVTYPCATIVTLDGIPFEVNKRMNEAFEMEVEGETDATRVNYIGESTPVHLFNKLVTKSFTITCFDDNDILNDIIGKVVFYSDNWGEGGYCFVTGYTKKNSFIKNSMGIYGNEVSLTLERTNYDDSIEYPL